MEIEIIDEMNKLSEKYTKLRRIYRECRKLIKQMEKYEMNTTERNEIKTIEEYITSQENELYKNMIEIFDRVYNLL